MRTLVRSLLRLCSRSAVLPVGLLPRPPPLLNCPCNSVCLRAMSSSSGDSTRPAETEGAPLTLDKSPDNWFAKFSRATDTPKGCFRGYSDRFNGITVDSALEGKVEGGVVEEIDFAQKIEASLQHWKATGKRGIWFKVLLKDSDWVPVLAKNGFKYHHAKDDFVMMFAWLPENEPANVPPFAHTMIGVGAVVVNDKDQILAVSEKNALIPNSWKLPGGYAEPKENLADSAAREVFEETSIVARFESVVAIRHAHGAGLGCSDIYVVIAMTPETEQIKKCDREIADCKWMGVEEFLTHEHVHETNRNFLRTYLSQKKQGIKIGCRDEIHPIIKRKYQVYDIVNESTGLNSSL